MSPGSQPAVSTLLSSRGPLQALHLVGIPPPGPESTAAQTCCPQVYLGAFILTSHTCRDCGHRVAYALGHGWGQKASQQVNPGAVTRVSPVPSCPLSAAK